MGRLTADPELRKTQSGVSGCRFTVAVNRKFKNKQTGETEADFISCQAWRQSAEFICKYFAKGRMICIEGSLRTGSYKDRQYQDVTHYTTDILVENVEFCGDKANNQQGNSSYAPPPEYAQPQQNAAQSVVNDAQRLGVMTNELSYGNMADFEEILSDGDVPF